MLPRVFTDLNSRAPLQALQGLDVCRLAVGSIHTGYTPGHPVAVEGKLSSRLGKARVGAPSTKAAARKGTERGAYTAEDAT